MARLFSLLIILCLCFVLNTECRPTSKTTVAGPILPSDLLVKLFGLIPAGPQYQTLYEGLGGKIGQIAWKQIPEGISSKFRFIGIRDGTGLGTKIGACLGRSGLLLTEGNDGIIGSFVGNIVERKAKEATISKVDDIIRQYRLNQYGENFVKMMREFSLQLGPNIGRKLTQCLLGNDQIPNYRLPSSFKLDDLLNVLPSGSKYESIYQDIGSAVAIQIFLAAEKELSVIMTRTQAIDTGRVLGAQVGKCIASYGWKLENKSNWLIDMLKPFVNGIPKLVNAQLQPKVDHIFNKFNLGILEPQLKPILMKIIDTFGPYIAERIVQCLLLPIDDISRDAILKPIARQAELDSAIIEQAPINPNHHHQQLHNNKQHSAVNVHVSVQV